jgi:hypothetical protein
VGSVAIAGAVRTALDKAFIEARGRLQKLDQHRRGRPRRIVEIGCECDGGECATLIRVHRCIYLKRDGRREQRFVATGHTPAGGNQVVLHAATGYQLVEACPHPRKFFWATDPWS